MTVDSEAIFAVAAHSRSEARSLEVLHGAMAAAWIDEREPDVLRLARGVGRPLWIGEGRDGVFFASTERALEIVEQYSGLRVRKRQVREGTLLALSRGKVARRERFRVNAFVEDDPLPAVRAPQEHAHCLTRLTAIVASA
jgi:glutamine phosphoribosylpyrophosphate amidotransferase